MRPPEFTGGNTELGLTIQDGGTEASMRPPEFTGGNLQDFFHHPQNQLSFNEAAGIHRRKPSIRWLPRQHWSCFNEAAGIHRRKPNGLWRS